jgi:membrane associated rhomboid family serine protease
MFLFLPIGLDDMKVGRWPVVSIALAIGCVLLFAATDADFGAWGLVPAEGVLQIGWISYPFLHADWMHLLGNLLFLYVSAPYVEDAWGMGRFLALYFVGGIVAGIGQLALDPGSTIPIIGASGAIAACMGAFCVQFPRRKVRMFWFFLRVTGTFFVPVWLWGGFWFTKELLYLVMAGSGSGVAFGAHLGGFAFGAVMAAAIIKIQGDPFELRYGRPKPVPAVRPPVSVPTPSVAAASIAEPPTSASPAPPSPRTPPPTARPPSPAPDATPPPPSTAPLSTPPATARPFPTKPRLRSDA